MQIMHLYFLRINILVIKEIQLYIKYFIGLLLSYFLAWWSGRNEKRKVPSSP